jgi:hypothetical protein
MKRSGERAHGIIDDINGTGRPFFDVAALPNVIARGSLIYISGWLYAPGAVSPPEIAITVDGAFGAVARSGYARPDVADVHGPGAAQSGFEATLPSGPIGEGVRMIAAAQLVDAMTYLVGPERRITIARNALRTTIETPAVAGVHVHLDRFAEGPQPPQMHGGIPAFGSETTLSVLGWAADLTHGQPCAAIYAIVDDVHLFRGRYGCERADVAAELGQPQLRYTGYEVRIDAGALTAGGHLIRVVALSADGEGRSEPTAALPFSIRPE